MTNSTDSITELNALQQVELDWIVYGNSVWTAIPHDLPEISPDVRATLERKIKDLADRKQPSRLGLPILGRGGSGKTHLLAYLRQIVFEKGGYFIMADMSTVSDFWSTLAHEASRSLLREGFDGQTQVMSLLQKLAELSGADDLKDLESFIDRGRAEDYAAAVDKVYRSLFKNQEYRVMAQEYQDLIRYLLLSISNDPTISNDGKFWFTTEREMEDAGKYGFLLQKKPSNEWFVIGLTWLFSIAGGFSVIAIDQLDSTVQLHALKAKDDDENEAAIKILISVSNGFSALITKAFSSLTVATFLADSWHTLIAKALKPNMDRFDHPRVLSPLKSATIAKKLLLDRISAGYEKVGFNPPYPTWPFPDKVFEELAAATPREVLKSARDHVIECEARNHVFECQTLTGGAQGELAKGTRFVDEFAPIEVRFRYHHDRCDLASLKAVNSENTFWPQSLAIFAETFAGSLYLYGTEQIVIGDDSRPLHKSYRAFTFLRHFYVDGGAADHCLSVWAILADNPRAFQSRVSTALDQSGIDKRLPGRRLAIIRFNPPPSGAVTAKKIKELEDNKALWIEIPDEDLRILYALYQVSGEFDKLFREWINFRKPAQYVRSILPHLEWLINQEPGALKPDEIEGQRWPSSTPSEDEEDFHGFFIEENGQRAIGDEDAQEAIEPTPLPPADTSAKGGHSPADTAPPATGPEAAGPAPTPIAAEAIGQPVAETVAVSPVQPGHQGPRPQGTGQSVWYPLPIGTITKRDRVIPVNLSAPVLLKHVGILGGTGSGKTVLMRRVIEEASLLGIPSVVIDISGDLCCLGQPWDDPKAMFFSPEDEEKANRYFSQTETVIWTPKVFSGNPLVFPVIPNLMALSGDQDALNEAVGLTLENIEAIEGMGMMKDVKKKGLIATLLRYMSTYSQEKTLTLEDLSDLLQDLPQEAYDQNTEEACKYGKKMAAELKGATSLDPSLKETDTTNVADLFRSSSGKTRISVVNLQGITSSKERETFVQKLVSSIFIWITKNPSNNLGCLVALDEAKDFVPNDASSLAKKSIKRFINQSRKFRCGMLLASQAIKSLDNQVVSNCGTLIVGRQSSPTNIKTCHDMGMLNVDALKTGEFIGRSESFPQPNQPTKFQASICLSKHPSPPPPMEWITEMARKHKIAYKL
ncbi:MAG: DUF853 family protein [Deltaproteobacteria bacterium]|jgi:energy-coupling factor transporter ATP-binding protein EcfA2|nr:DUF853 family protein [Deltaproteobacteria bacterium]